MTFTYELRKPAAPAEANPVVFLLHGMGSNEQDMLALGEELSDRFYVFSLRGHLPHPPGYAYFTIEEFGKPHYEVFADAMERLTEFIEDSLNEHPIDPEHVYLAGFSQGAIASLSLGLMHQEQIRGVGALSCYLPAFMREHAAAHLSVYMAHGTADPVLPYAWGEEARHRLEQGGVGVQFTAFDGGHAVPADIKQGFQQWIRAMVERGQQDAFKHT
ncbi:alpha/beta hydrolase [Bacillus daqingensis]|uniref:Alpha/beta hydrolase n=1 Tax=Bacillus daqingensis TaxID=872396 RepID=A0ABV9NWQ7_9BACI